ncbi:helix-turn-helix transcriptional regulator [Rossellomorea oryzaecorticis]|uniref:Helix-turn-helix transcriptional regulator n=1 Tax=Rossellomorea oryzaecorticis TaxID=1396505 RepID=A0ABU9K3Z4_9BACI
MNGIDHFTLGQRIKYVRSLKKIKQSGLAEGICSVSYLSKVENDSLTPSKEVERALLKRLGIYNKDKSFEQVLSNRIDDWFQSIGTRDIEEAASEYKELKQQLSLTSSEIILIKFKLFSVKYYIELKRHEEAYNLLENIRESQFIMDYPLLYYYEKFQGTIRYIHKEFNSAYEHFEAAKKYSEFIDIPLGEKSSLFYSLGLVTGKLNMNQTSIDYTKKALSIYQSVYDFKKCANCHILLGILHKRINQFSEAIEEYKKAREIALMGGYTSILHTIEHNLGTLYSHFRNSNLAIRHFKNSLEFECRTEDVCNTYISLSKEYYISRMVHEAKKALTSGYKKLADSDKVSDILQLEYEILDRLYNGDIDRLDNKLLKAILPAFEEEDQFWLLSEYLTFIGEYYYENGKYKKSARYYSLANKYLKRLQT